MPVMIDIPRLVCDHEIVVTLIHGVLEDHEVRDQHLIHAADRLEAMKIVLARFQFDVTRLACQTCAERMDTFAAGIEQARDGILCQPVHLQVGVMLAQFAGDGDITPSMPKADRRGQIQCALGPFGSARRRLRRGDAEPAIQKIHDQGIAFCRDAAKRVVAAARDRHELRPRHLGDKLRASMRYDVIIVAVDHQNRAAYSAIHCLADVKCRVVSSLDGVDEHLATRPACPFDAILDLLGRVRFGEDVADEVLGKVSIVGKPVTAVPLFPAFK